MPTIIFVHGTGVREPAYTTTFIYIRDRVTRMWPTVPVVRCPWGEEHGTVLVGASIPLYDSSRSIEDEVHSVGTSNEDDEVDLWRMLYDDPFFELQTFALEQSGEYKFVPNQEQPSDIVDYKLQNLVVSAHSFAYAREAGLEGILVIAIQEVRSSSAYHDALESMGEDSRTLEVIVARAIVAKAIALAEEKYGFVPISTDVLIREEMVALLLSDLGTNDTERGVTDTLRIGRWIARHTRGAALHIGTHLMQRRRGGLTEIISPFIGDIMLYQARGGTIRDFIRRAILETAQSDPDIVLLAHSLGGVACVDLLVLEKLPVRQLITVGSQAPFFYELNALHSLEYPNPLPDRDHFPPWLNIYDQRDFLSYVGAKLFPDRIQDVAVNNHQPFPRVHSSYWTNVETWSAIASRLKL